MPRYAVVDIFAGPGGLAEGFSDVRDDDGKPAFSIDLSIEKETAAHSTLLLRSFLRQFNGSLPDVYYDFINKKSKEPDWSKEFPEEWKRAEREAWKCELGGEASIAQLDARLDEIRSASEGNVILIGGPPCQAYSLVGRSRNQGKEGYVAKEDSRHFLYKEYIRILDRLRPAAFVMDVNAGAKTDHVAAQNQASGGVAKRHGARAPQVAGACHGALARRANPAAADQELALAFRARLWASL